MKIPYWPLLVGPAILFAFGFFLNGVTAAVNGGRMPAFMSPCEFDPMDWMHTCFSKATHLRILADWIYMGKGYESVGDIFENLYELTFLPALVAWIALMIRGANDGNN
jgi:hypothetical protein